MSKLTEDEVEYLVRLGGNHFKVGTVDRVYFGANCLGLRLEYKNYNHNSNMIRALLHNKEITRVQGARLNRLKHWIDVETGECHTTRHHSTVDEPDGLQEELKKLLASAKKKW